MRAELYTGNDYAWIRELLQYPDSLGAHLDFFATTADISLPVDPIERVVFQDRAKAAIRKIAQNRGHILMVGRPGTGKSLLANMFKEVLDRSMGEYLRPSLAIVAYPGKDRHHIRIAYESPEVMDRTMARLIADINTAAESIGEFNLDEPIRSVRRAKYWLAAASAATALAGIFFPPAFIATGLTGIGAIFMFIQENQYRAQE